MLNELNDSKENSIEITKILSILLVNKKLIIQSTFIVFILSLIYSVTLNNFYRASSTFYPHYEKIDNTNNIRSLAGLAGINLEIETSSNIPSNLYPKIISSPIFKNKILDKELNYNGESITIRQYLNRKPKKFSIKEIIFYPITLISKIFNHDDEAELNPENKDDLSILNISNSEYSLHQYLDQIILINLNEKEGFIEISVDDENPIIASQIATFAEKILQESIIDFKIKNIKETFNFTKNQFNIAKKNFYILQDSLAIFKDKNKNIKSDLFLIQLDRIEFEYNLSKNIYNELALNKEKIAIEVRKNTPIFTIINPVVIPNEKHKPNRSFIVILYTFFGLILVSLWVLIRKPLDELFRLIDSKSLNE
tara:strand:+ start:780 stop:1880 length:1101 start_codon:yes stop_codon:yes gene_type:complete